MQTKNLFAMLLIVSFSTIVMAEPIVDAPKSRQTSLVIAQILLDTPLTNDASVIEHF